MNNLFCHTFQLLNEIFVQVVPAELCD